MKGWLLGMLACLACVQEPPPPPVAPKLPVADYYPKLGTAAYDARRYHLELSLDPTLTRVDGTATMQAEARAPLTEIAIDLHGDLEVSKCTLNGQSARYLRTPAKVLIQPAPALEAGSLFETRISYSGKPSQSLFNDRPRGWLTIPPWDEDFEPHCTAVAEPFAAHYWFPCNNWLQDKAFYSFTIHVPGELVATANGRLAGREGQTYRYRARDPIAPYLVTVGAADFEVIARASRRGVHLRSYVPRETGEPARKLVERTGEVVDFLAEVLGPYPFETAGIHVLRGDEVNWALNETQTCPVISEFYLSEAADVSWLVHELAHQWLGNSVSLKSWGDNWIKEGGASYCEGLWIEREQGRDAYSRWLAKKYRDAQEHKLLPIHHPPEGETHNPAVYLRGALVYAKLRERFGDERFFRFLRTWCDRYRNSSAGYAEFSQLAAEVFGSQALPVLAEWVESAQLPNWGGKL